MNETVPKTGKAGKTGGLPNHAVVDLEAYRLAERCFWLNASLDIDMSLEEIYQHVLSLMESERQKPNN